MIHDHAGPAETEEKSEAKLESVSDPAVPLIFCALKHLF
jgi:hypothetical protein